MASSQALVPGRTVTQGLDGSRGASYQEMSRTTCLIRPISHFRPQESDGHRAPTRLTPRSPLRPRPLDLEELNAPAA